MTQGPNPSLYLFEEIIPKLKQHGIQFIDLTENFAQVDDPSMLYFHYDAHWNNTGMYRAAREIMTHIEKKIMYR